MEMKGEYRIPAPRERVWAALNDPEILKACIPGCESLESSAENEFKATVKAKVGPVSARFSGRVTLSDFDPPKSYRISGEGQGGAAGFAKGGAVVELEESGSETVLRYTADAQVGGKLAQIGSRLIDGTAKKLADEFFEAFAARVGGEQSAAAGSAQPAEPAAVAPPTVAPPPIVPPSSAAAPASVSQGWRVWAYAGGAVVIAIVAYLALR